MNGYENLSWKQAEFVWDKKPEDERDLVMDEINRIIEAETGDPEPCHLYDVCQHCPNFTDCFGVSAISSQVMEGTL